MKVVLEPFQFLVNQDLSASFNSDPIEAFAYYGLSIQNVVTALANLTGSLKVQVSNDKITWADFATFSALSVTTNTANVWLTTAIIPCKWMRLVWTATPAPVAASKHIQKLTYTAKTAGSAGNAITIAYTTGATAGAEVVTVVGSAISVQIQTGVSTATQVKAAVDAKTEAAAIVSVAIDSGQDAVAQTAPVTVTALASGDDSAGTLNTLIAGVRV